MFLLLFSFVSVFRCNGAVDVIFDLMLEQFTWFEFFACALPLMAGWYIWLLLMYKGRGSHSFGRLTAIGAGGGSASNSDGFPDGGMNAERDLRRDSDLMGRSKVVEGLSAAVVSDVIFGQVDDEKIPSDLIADVIAELKEVFAILAKEDGTKVDFFRLMLAVRESYPGLGSHPGLASLNAFVSDHAPFLLTVAELESLWD